MSQAFEKLSFPFPQKEFKGITDDSMHFQQIDLSREVMVPIAPHVGGFGVVRKFHVHEGVDLYCVHGDPVYCVEPGIVKCITPFTGEHAGSPWWNNTFAVLVEGEHGQINYGEIIPHPQLKIGDRVQRGDHLGDVTEILMKDKGRPRSMLHFELYTHGEVDLATWKPNRPKPARLLDPTQLLVTAATSGNRTD